MNETRIPVGSSSQWRIPLACTIGNMVGLTPVISVSFSIFLIPIAQEFGCPRAHVSGVLAMNAVLLALCYPIVGRLADRLGSRRVLTIGMLIFALAVMLLSQIRQSLPLFYALFALVGITGSIPSTPAFTKVISEWFDRYRGFLLALTAGVGNGVGAAIFPILAAILMTRLDWRSTYAVLGLIVLCTGFPTLFFLLRDAPRGHAATATGAAPMEGLTLREAMHTPVFWLAMATFALAAGCVQAVLTHVIPIVMENGVSLAVGTGVLTTFVLVCTVAQILVGAALDRARSPAIIAPTFLVAAIGLMILQFSASTPLLFVAGTLLGVGLGAEYGALPYLLSRYFGLRQYGVIAGIVYGAVMIVQGVTPFLMDSVYDHSGSYVRASEVVAACLCLCSISLIFLPRFVLQMPTRANMAGAGQAVC